MQGKTHAMRSQWKTTLNLLLLTLAAAGLLRMWETLDSTSKSAVQIQARLPLPRAETVRKWRIQTDQYHVQGIRENGRWQLTHPFAARADSGRIEHILSRIENLTVHQIISREQRERRHLAWKDYGLESPRALFSISDDLSRQQLRIGHDAPLSDMLYASLDKHEEIFVLDRSILDAIPADMDSLRDRSVVPGDPTRATRLEIQRPHGGFIRLAKQHHQWHLQQPVSARADNATISAMLTTLRNARIDRFVWDRPSDSDGAPAPPPPEAAYQLAPDEAALVLTLWTEEDGIPRDLLLGRSVADKPNRLYAKHGGSDSIFTVPQALLQTFAVADLNALRSRDVFPLAPSDVAYARFEAGRKRLRMERCPRNGWQIADPVQWKADEIAVGTMLRAVTGLRIAEFADGSQTNLAALGLDPPDLVLQIARQPPTDPEHNLLHIGSPEPERLFARFAADAVVFGEGATVYEIAPGQLRPPGAHWADPLAVRDRTMLAIDPSEVRLLSLQRGARRQRVERSNADTPWQDAHAPRNEVHHAVVEQILFQVAHLRAQTLHARNPEDLSVYGLDPPTAALTLGLSGRAGIRKTILLGRASETSDGVYAMIQGQPLVFSLVGEEAANLTADLVAPPAQNEGADPEDGAASSN